MGFNRVSFLHTGLSLPYLSGAYPRRASNYRISSISHHFYYPQHVRGRDFIKRMVKITQSCLFLIRGISAESMTTTNLSKT